jgi:hypothetical protein
MRFRIFISVAALVAGFACAAGSAQATTVLVDGSCVSVTDSDGCLFQGTINDQYYSTVLLGSHPNSYLNAVIAYNNYVATNPSAGPAINIAPIGESAGAPSLGDINATTDQILAPDGTTVIGEIDFTQTDVTSLKLRSGTWELYAGEPDAAFLAVDAGQEFVLYQLSNPSTSGDWDTFDLPGEIAGQNPKLYRLVLFTDPPAGVPEPATWAMLLLGFGMVGASMRMMRRRQSLARA